MACRAVLRCGLVEEHGFGGNNSGQLVAPRAAHVLVRPAQRKFGPLLVVKQGRLPRHAGVALRAARDIPFGELLSVDVLVAVLALRRRGLEVHIHQLSFKIGGLVAINASRSAVRAEQRKLCLRMVEAREFLPRLRGVASFAPRHRTVGPRQLHALFELSLVRIVVATGAVQSLPVVNHCRLRLELRRFLVTVGAGNRNVPAREHEVRLLVLGQAERGRLVSLEIVAAVAGVEVGRRDKLPGMPVGVTVDATLELDLEKRVFPFRDMTLRTFNRRMLPLQRIRTGGVLLHGKGRRLPSLHGVAGSALSAVRTLGKLAVVRIGLVAVHTLLEYQRLLEISVSVALGTIDTGVPAFQRELGLGVVEALVDGLERNLLPPARVVA